MKKVISIILTLVIVMAFGTTAFAAEADEITTANGSASKDVEINYTYAPDTDTAAKHFYVTLAFTLPATLKYNEGEKVYKWNTETGKYEADSTKDVAGAGTLSDNGKFSITVTNQSNVGITYSVAYTPDAEAVFASEAADDWENNEDVTIATIAKGQEIGKDGIFITSVDDATADKTDAFVSETCTGSITVTGINEGKTPSASGTDKLGTFKVTIGEAKNTLTIGNIIPKGVTGRKLEVDFSALDEGDQGDAQREYEQENKHLGEYDSVVKSLDHLAHRYSGCIRTTELKEGDTIPTDGAVALTAGGYNYELSKNGWVVNAVDKTKEKYSAIYNSIAGIPVVSMRECFKDCNAMTVAPEIPQSVVILESAFAGCSKLTVAPAMPENVITYYAMFDGCTEMTTLASPIIYSEGANMFGMFVFCEKLNGEIEIVGTPKDYNRVFGDYGLDMGTFPIGDNKVVLTGTCDPDVLAAIAENNPNVSVKAD